MKSKNFTCGNFGENNGKQIYVEYRRLLASPSLNSNIQIFAATY
jgi:hypothetical protein